MIGRFRTILGVRFFTGSALEAVEFGLGGGLVVVPSAPVLVGMETDGALRMAVQDADLAIADSGLMVLLWRFFGRQRIPRTSGLAYLSILLGRSEIREPNATFWIMPNAAAWDRAARWLKGKGISARDEDCYVAPLYPSGEIADLTLVKLLERRRPLHVIVCVGGCVQERLGYSLKHSLNYRPGIHCIGAAIGFLSGDQVRIPTWADRLFLGWLFRCLSDPRRFVPRYWRAARLVTLIWRFRERAPGGIGSARMGDSRVSGN
jgi:UDP-N-acetyl-D-mannosaminuronic acid transferase (WecB/TagA/CpsF family)